jgi:hypothetical protein
MYPKVFTEFARVTETYGPVGVLPTPVYFYGLKPEDEIAIELEKGKTLIVRCLGRADPDEDRHGACVLRTQRPAAHHQGARPQPWRDGRGRAPQGRSRRSLPMSPRLCPVSSPRFR